MHVTLLYNIFIKTINTLCFRKRSQCNDIANLCLTTCKHCTTVNSRHQINLSTKRSDFINLTTVRTLMVLKNHLTNCLLLILIDGFTKNLKPFFVIGKCFFKLLCNALDVLFSNLLLISKYCIFHLLRRYDFFNLIEHFLRNGTTCI